MVAVIVSIDLVLLLALGFAPEQQHVPLFSAQHLQQNMALLTGGAIACAAVIGLASLYRITSLRSGGGQVARELGGTLVDIEPADPLRRRLRNVVEEIALASGVAVPEIYVLEKEAGINAFAAGFSPSDAAIAVTRGALEKLSRDELQGVIAHEFSHILNGDMRLNIRLMGALFGILLLAIIGRRVLMHTRHLGGSRNKNGGAIILIAIGLLLVGYVGQFFGRWIKAAVSRQREYLADASAVQFTRNNLGIGGALKKIAVYSEGSLLAADSEEIDHMLFGSGRKMMLFATHPPIEQRIRAVDPGFQPEELARLRAKLVQQEVKRAEEQEAERARAAAAAEARPAAGANVFLNPANLIEQIGKPGWEHIVMAAALTASIPLNIRRAAQSTEWAVAVLFYTLLDSNRETRERQLLLVAQRLGSHTESQVRSLLDAGGDPAAEQRLPLLELAFPALKRHPLEQTRKVMATMQDLVEIDGRTDIFEFLLSRVTRQHLWESQSPSSVRVSGHKSLAACKPQALRLLAILAIHGNPPESAASSFSAGATVLEEGQASLEAHAVGDSDWPRVLDQDLPALDRLQPAAKQQLIAALVATVMRDGKAVPAEMELLRVTCDLLHVPLPMLTGRRPS